jgi:poly-gamma-glutamate synthesis protein (capsule biosynthesis protein)
MRLRTAALLPSLLLAATAPSAAAQVPPTSGTLKAPKLLATGLPLTLRGVQATPGARIELQLRRPRGWVTIGARKPNARGRYRFRYRPKRPQRRLRLRAVAPNATPSNRTTTRFRHVTLAAVGDINLGDGVAAVMYQRGFRFPWSGVAPTLRRADVAFGNLECAVSNRGYPVPKEYNFRGRPAALRVTRRYAGMDVLNLANNHIGDFGTAALLDTLSYLRRFNIVGVGAGRNLKAAAKPRIIERLGLRIAFVGISDVVPPGFAAGLTSPGTTTADPSLIRAAVSRARRKAHIVVATFHWGIERDTQPSGRQRFLAGVARAAGAHAVIGAHPHVLQPVERGRHKVTAYSLGNFVWSAGSSASSATGILRLKLSTRGVEGARLLRAVIEGTRPRLLRG